MHRLLNFLHPSSSLSQAQQAHAQILKTGLSDHLNLTTKLLSLYANALCFTEAKLLLASISHPNLFSFSTLIHAFAKFDSFANALSIFSQMLSRGLTPDSFLFPSVVKACAGLRSSHYARMVHAVSFSSGLGLDSFVQSSLVHMYMKCDMIGDARRVFDRMPERNVVVYSALISGFSRRGCADEAVELLDEMKGLGFDPNVVLWNGMIAGFSQSKLYADSVGVFQRMHLEGFYPDGSTVASVLPAAGDLEGLAIGTQIHGYVIKRGMISDKCVVSALVDMYGKCACTSEMSRVIGEMDELDVGACNALVTGFARNGLVDDALEVFREFKGRGVELNAVSWTSIIGSCSQNGKDMEALDLLREMQIEGVVPNSMTISCFLPACGNIAALMHGKAAHCFALRRGIVTDVYVGSALIDMYAKCGKIRFSRLCFDKMPTRNLVCCNAVMSGYAMHGKATETREIFHMMQRSGQRPDSISFTCVLSACSQNGLTEEGWYYFNSMSKDYGIEARLEHYACMVTLLGRAGKLDEAYSMIKKMPFEPDACVWGALLSSCRVHNNVTLGESTAKKLFHLEPGNPGNYILLSNIYASKGLWTEVDRVRDTMKSLGLRKNPGCSWIEFKNKVHMLVAGDKTHPEMSQITEKLSALYSKLKDSGYFPNTNLVLQDVEEQEKEQILCGHSEKLAVALGILNTPPGSSLRVIKNLRICGDCHSVIKFISSLEGREISVRDTNRFHHFKDGVCSCGDYW